MGGSSSQTVGYRYLMGMHLAICASDVDEIQAIIVGERLAWEGSITSNTSVTINQPNLFGGEEKEGGIVGKVDLLFGLPDQTTNDYLVRHLGTDLPAYRGIVSLVLNQVYLTATTPYPKPWAVRVKSIQGRALNPTMADINGSMNAANIIYEAWTNSDWGLGNPPSDIDMASFTAASTLFFTEGMGFSFQLVESQTAEDFIINVLSHCNAVLSISRTTGQLNLIPIRESDDPVTVTYNEDNIIEVASFERPTYSEIVNEVTITYRPQAALKDASVTAQNLSSIQAAGTIINQKVDYPGVDNETLANRIALRDLRQLSTPLARVSLSVNRSAWDLIEGDLFNFTWSPYGVQNIVMRVLSIDYGKLDDREIRVVAQQDVYALPSATYTGVQPPLWNDPVGPPQDALSIVMQELSYWDLVTTLNAADFNALPEDAVRVRTFVEKPPIATSNYQLHTAPTGGDLTRRNNGQYTPVTTNEFELNAIETSVIVDFITQEMLELPIGSYAYIDNEAVILQEVNTANNTIIISRGTLDTCPRPHNANSTIYFGQTLDGQDQTLYLENETITGVAVVQTSQGAQEVSDAITTTYLTEGRFQKPYPPANLEINTLAYPDSINGNLIVSWAHRDRLTQTAELIPTTTGDIGPEAGTTYTVVIRNALNNVILHTEAGISTTSFTYTVEDEIAETGLLASRYAVEVSSQRGAETSFQTLFHIFDRVNIIEFDLTETPTEQPTFNLTTGLV